jgi:hypothetical protein
MILRQRSPSTMSFHPADDGLDDLDAIILKHVSLTPGISVTALASRMVFYNKDDHSEETRAPYAQIWYRVKTLEKEGLIISRREPSNKGMEKKCYKGTKRRCYPP